MKVNFELGSIKVKFNQTKLKKKIHSFIFPVLRIFQPIYPSTYIDLEARIHSHKHFFGRSKSSLKEFSVFPFFLLLTYTFVVVPTSSYIVSRCRRYIIVVLALGITYYKERQVDGWRIIKMRLWEEEIILEHPTTSKHQRFFILHSYIVSVGMCIYTRRYTASVRNDSGSRV